MISKRATGGALEGAHAARADATHVTAALQSRLPLRRRVRSTMATASLTSSPSSGSRARSRRLRATPTAGPCSPRSDHRGEGARGDVLQSFLQGHTDEISCLAISRDGRMLASGRITNMGFSADIIVWDLEARHRPRMSLHKVKVAGCPSRTTAITSPPSAAKTITRWSSGTSRPAAVCGTPV